MIGEVFSTLKLVETAPGEHRLHRDLEVSRPVDPRSWMAGLDHPPFAVGIYGNVSADLFASLNAKLRKLNQPKGPALAFPSRWNPPFNLSPLD